MHHIRSNIFSRGWRSFCQPFIMLCCFIFFMAAEGFADEPVQVAPALEANAQVPDAPTSFPDQTPLKIYFFNPEINASRNLVLKNTWDSFLGKHGNFSFQPVDGLEDFKGLLEQEQGAAFIMSEWLFNNLKLKSREVFKVVMQGLKGGQDTYRRILVGNSGELDLEKARIASSGDKARNLKILADMFPELSAQQIGQLKLLEVPKDIDALLALGYGLADLALTSEISLANMAMLNENRFRELDVIKQSKPLGQSILVFKTLDESKRQAVARSLINMPDTSHGRRAINMIGLDDWKILDTSLSSIVSLAKDDTSKPLQDSDNNKGGRQ